MDGEGEPLAIRRPTRAAGADAFRGEGNGVAAGCGNHPNTGFALIFVPIDCADRVGDPAGVRTDLRSADILNLEIIGNGDGARGGGRQLGANCKRREA